MAILDFDTARARDIAAETGGLALPCDVTAARIVVNCAGIASAARIVGRDGDLSLDLFARVIGVNLNGTVIRLDGAVRLPPR